MPIDLTTVIRNVPDFPKPGIQFKDITTLLLSPSAFAQVIETFKRRYQEYALDLIVGIESRGFIFGAALAYAMNVPFAPARKPGKLPAKVISESFSLEYGTDTVEMHCDAVQTGQKVLVVDDLLATGGTAAAVCSLVRKLGGEVTEAAFVVELLPLHGREKLAPIPVFTQVVFHVEE